MSDTPTQWAYDQVCKANEAKRQRIEELEAENADLKRNQERIAQLESEVEHYIRRLAEAGLKRDEFRAELMNIATAKPHEWTDSEPDLEFRLWAQNRARAALGDEARKEGKDE